MWLEHIDFIYNIYIYILFWVGWGPGCDDVIVFEVGCCSMFKWILDVHV